MKEEDFDKELMALEGNIRNSLNNYITPVYGSIEGLETEIEIGNCFKTEEEAERVVEYLKALAVVRGDATSKFTRDRDNFYVYYDVISNHLAVGVSFYDLENGIFGLPYFATIDDAKRSIEQHKNEWLTIFGVEDKNEVKK